MLSRLQNYLHRGNRSRFIDRAVRRYIESESKRSLRARLKSQVIENADRDLQIAAEWFPLEEQVAALAETGRSAARSLATGVAGAW